MVASLESVDRLLTVNRYTPRPLALAIVHGKVAAIHNIILDIEKQIFDIFGRRRVRKRELLLELKLIDQKIKIVIRMMQELEQELKSAARG